MFSVSHLIILEENPITQTVTLFCFFELCLDWILQEGCCYGGFIIYSVIYLVMILGLGISFSSFFGLSISWAPLLRVLVTRWITLYQNVRKLKPRLLSSSHYPTKYRNRCVVAVNHILCLIQLMWINSQFI